jgi:hypothetical protein
VRDVDEERDILVPESSETDVRCPKVKPARSSDDSPTGPMIVVGISASVPSSAIELWGSIPGRGKNTERLRECIRLCLRPFIADEEAPPELER